MALINCKECNNLISSEAEKCIYCGAGINKSQGMKIAEGIAVFALVIMLIKALMGYYH